MYETCKGRKAREDSATSGPGVVQAAISQECPDTNCVWILVSEVNVRCTGQHSAICNIRLYRVQQLCQAPLPLRLRYLSPCAPALSPPSCVGFTCIPSYRPPVATCRAINQRQNRYTITKLLPMWKSCRCGRGLFYLAFLDFLTSRECCKTLHNSSASRGKDPSNSQMMYWTSEPGMVPKSVRRDSR
jgi:hypothetical protein